MVMVEEQDDYFSDSDSDDDDVDRYVFLARQPSPAGRHAEDDDRDASSANDDDDGDDGDGTTGEEESEGAVGTRKPLREILGDDAPPPTKKAQLELIIASPLAAQTPPSGSESSSPRAGESWSEGSHEKAHEHRAPTPKEQGEAKNATKKKRAACGKRSRSPGGEVDGDRDDAAAAAAAAKTAGASSGATATPGRFPCSLCDRCFDSHQALGGHVLGHRKRTKIAIAAGAILDADDTGEESAATEEAPNRIVQADKDLVAARRGKANGDGSSSDEGKTIDDAAERGDEDANRARHKRQRKVHGNGKGKGGVREPVFAGSHCDANGNDGSDNKCNPIAVSGNGFTDGSDDGKMDIGTASPNRKVACARTCHEGADGNGNGDGNVFRTRYKCKVCGTECLTGRALGGHMRKHWKRPPVGGGGDGGGEERSPSPATDHDCQTPLAQLFGAETSLQREM